MGSSKRHKTDKNRDGKKKRHRSRSRSRSYSPERDRMDKHKHHKKHKKKDRKDYDSDVEIISAPPPPKISRISTHYSTSPPTEVLHGGKDDRHSHQSREDRYSGQSKEDRYGHGKNDRPSRQKKSPSPAESGKAHASLSIEETNKLRAKLGLKPLAVDSGPKEGSDIIKDDLGEFRHKPAINTAEKEKTQKIKEKLDVIKQKRLIESSLAAVKTLGDDDSDDGDASEWIKKMRKIETEKKKAAERAKLLDQMDEEFGIGNLIKEDVNNEKRNAYTGKHLKGLRVEHNVSDFKDGSSIILTLKDQDILAKDDDVLVNVNMKDDERYKKNVLIKAKKPGYDAFDESYYDEYGMSKAKVLEKYDEEIDGEKRDSFAIGSVDLKAMKAREAEIVKNRLANKRLESLEFTNLKMATDYYNEEEMVKFKKPKKKIKKIRRKFKADDLIQDNNDYLKDLGSRRRRREEPTDILDVDDVDAPKEDLSRIKIEDDDRDLDRKIKQKAQRLKGPITLLKPENIAIGIKQEMDKAEPNVVGSSGSIVLNSTAEFCRTLGDIPTYGQAGNREENQEFMDFEMDEVKPEYSDDEMNERSAWNSVDVENSTDPAAMEAAILDAEPSLDHGVGGALKLAMSKGYLQKEDSNRPSASRFAHLKAQNYSIEDKAYGDEDKFGRRDRFNGPTMDFKEKDTFRPNVKLEYIDDDGHVLNAKEAFRYLSHKFHGKGPGKNKVEKRMKKAEQECLMKRMSSTDTPLGTLTLLQAKQKETQSPFIVLSGNKHMQTASISKSKN
ncbi:U4/U6.U5 tri-snRNP-associated protein 1 [Copidosoma floridanum]|uniref:U4/U6.U5 tri-snRNP-associated protein 1 n=1 Tax=Copidosoma floridanum TaxID=29053 RepID=UPI0006C9AD27|nr:U4/U6.U5 tri-snRNP-associated protein 1 [Copidosoma floridanum]